jgi:signal transduction histidine kinase
MKLARKITIGLTATIVVVMSLYAFYLTDRHVVLYQGDIEGYEDRGEAVRLLLRKMWANQGPEATRTEVENIVDAFEDVDVRWFDLSAPPGKTGYVELSPGLRAALERGTAQIVVGRDAKGQPVRHSFIPMQDGNPAVLEITRHLHRELSFIRASQTAILVTTIAVVLACSLTALFLGYWLVGRPVQLLRDRARRAGEGDFSGCVRLRQRDEMGELGDEIDEMCERIAEAGTRLAAETEAKVAALERMRHAERLASVGRFASGIAHELGTPLNVVSARAKMIDSDLQQKPQVRAHARVIGEQAARMTDMIRQLLDLSRRRSTRMGAVSVGQCVKVVVEMLAPVAAGRNVTTETITPEAPLVVRLDPGEAQQVLSNVVLNAIQASREGGLVRVVVEECQAAPPAARGGAAGHYVRILITDEGEGISPENLAHVFEPFFTTKGPGEGTGLGLAIAEGIVQDAGGWIAVTSTPGRGTQMSIWLPPAQGASVARADAS